MDSVAMQSAQPSTLVCLVFLIKADKAFGGGLAMKPSGLFLLLVLMGYSQSGFSESEDLSAKNVSYPFYHTEVGGYTVQAVNCTVNKGSGEAESGKMLQDTNSICGGNSFGESQHSLVSTWTCMFRNVTCDLIGTFTKANVPYIKDAPENSPPLRYNGVNVRSIGCIIPNSGSMSGVEAQAACDQTTLAHCIETMDYQNSPEGFKDTEEIQNKRRDAGRGVQ